MKILYLLKNFLFPSACALCGRSFISALEIRYGLCQECHVSLKPVYGEKCNQCGKPLVSEKEVCLSCRNGRKNSYDRLWVLFPYTGKYRKLLSEYKFRNNLPLANFLAEKIPLVLSEGVLKDAVLVPVPPRPGKIKAGGWDQVDTLVKRLTRINKDLPVSRCLKRRKSKIQKFLTRTERLENLKGRIYIHGKPPKTALIIDDVITTGSTMEVCASVLKENGAEKVYALCLFYD
jgi:ComF family protein